MLPNMPFRKADAHPLRLNTRCKDLTLVPSIDQKADNKNGGKDITFFPFTSFKHLALFYRVHFAVLNSRGVVPKHGPDRLHQAAAWRTAF